jgi:hypothetical protein
MIAGLLSIVVVLVLAIASAVQSTPMSLEDEPDVPAPTPSILPVHESPGQGGFEWGAGRPPAGRIADAPALRGRRMPPAEGTRAG